MREMSAETSRRGLDGRSVKTRAPSRSDGWTLNSSHQDPADPGAELWSDGDPVAWPTPADDGGGDGGGGGGDDEFTVAGTPIGDARPRSFVARKLRPDRRTVRSGRMQPAAHAHMHAAAIT